jgi:hypothetical protein
MSEFGNSHPILDLPLSKKVTIIEPHHDVAGRNGDHRYALA